MASKHLLSLEVPDTNNVKVFRIFDTSFYANELSVDCSTLRITCPGFNAPVVLEILPNFNLVLNACSLGLQSRDCGSIDYSIPDGIYTIHYSVSPNTQVFVEYRYLRITQTLNKYYKFLATVEMSSCEPDADVKALLDELTLIKNFIDAAKAKVEYGNDPETGIELLLYAQKKLTRLTGKCVTC